MNDLFYEYMDNFMVLFSNFFILYKYHTWSYFLKKKCTLHKIDKFEFRNIEMNNYRYIFWNDDINDF